MPRYVVERTFSDGLRIPLDEEGARACSAVVAGNTLNAVTWLHSYVSQDLCKTYCIYDGPNPEAIRESARNNNLPIDSVVEVCVLDPYFYRG
jgi:hypothetical protein